MNNCKADCETCKHRGTCNKCPGYEPKPKFARCGRCGREAEESASEWFIQCTNPECGITGPVNDPTGEKWDAMNKALGEHALLRGYTEHATCYSPMATSLLAKLDAMGESER